MSTQFAIRNGRVRPASLTQLAITISGEQVLAMQLLTTESEIQWGLYPLQLRIVLVKRRSAVIGTNLFGSQWKVNP